GAVGPETPRLPQTPVGPAAFRRIPPLSHHLAFAPLRASGTLASAPPRPGGPSATEPVREETRDEAQGRVPAGRRRARPDRPGRTGRGVALRGLRLPRTALLSGAVRIARRPLPRLLPDRRRGEAGGLLPARVPHRHEGVPNDLLQACLRAVRPHREVHHLQAG